MPTAQQRFEIETRKAISQEIEKEREKTLGIIRRQRVKKRKASKTGLKSRRLLRKQKRPTIVLGGRASFLERANVL